MRDYSKLDKKPKGWPFRPKPIERIHVGFTIGKINIEKEPILSKIKSSLIKFVIFMSDLARRLN